MQPENSRQALFPTEIPTIYGFEAETPEQGLYRAVDIVTEFGSEELSRNGPVKTMTSPFSIYWKRPWDRILGCAVRDANPFFHWLEAFWMLAGREDVEFPAYYASNIKSFSDDGQILNGAYGYRWRQAFGFDQLVSIIESLRANPSSRREVLGMWSPGNFYSGRALDGDTPMRPSRPDRPGDYTAASRYGSKDVCCNLDTVFRVVGGRLQMAVMNRSNDVVWGACGANLVHFTILQQFVAENLGLRMGLYSQMSANMHVYLENPVAKKVIADIPNHRWTLGLEEKKGEESFQRYVPMFDVKNGGTMAPESLLKAIERLLLPVSASAEQASSMGRLLLDDVRSTFLVKESPFMDSLAILLALQVAYRHYKSGDFESAYSALNAETSRLSTQPKLHTACIEWLQRREASRKVKP